jgi:arsenate reductase
MKGEPGPDTRHADGTRMGQQEINHVTTGVESGTATYNPGQSGDPGRQGPGPDTRTTGDPETKKQSVLFICSRNAGRSPLAEGLLRGIYGNRYEVYSAGFRPSTLNPRVREVLEEQGIESRSLHSKALQDIPPGPFDRVVLLNDQAEDGIPLPPAREYLRCSFPDPQAGSNGNGMGLEGFRNLRDQMKEWILKEF